MDYKNQLKDKKPRKTIYPTAKQDKIRNKIERLAKKIGKQHPVEKIYLFGSLLEGKFGKYEKPFGNRKRKGSDIDLLIITKKDFKPNWKLIGKYKSNDLYIIAITHKIHEIHGIVFNERKHLKKEAKKYGLFLNKTNSRKVRLLFSKHGE